MLNNKTWKGAWDAGTTYDTGDVVYFTDGFVYFLQKPCDAGITPANTLYWGKLGQEAAEVLMILRSVLEKIPTNINDEGIVLKGTEDAEYLITVDDSGETPELAVDLIEEEGDGD